jgi:Mg-chelatase subunit ChlD
MTPTRTHHSPGRPLLPTLAAVLVAVALSLSFGSVGRLPEPLAAMEDTAPSFEAQPNGPAVDASPDSPVGGSGALTYRLAAEWSHEGWKLTPGRYGSVSDISSAPDGTLYVLDEQRAVVHQLDETGAPLSIVHLPDAGPDSSWTPKRLDVGVDGDLRVLLRGPRDPDTGLYDARVDRVTPAGMLLSSCRMTAALPRAFVDVAVRSDGRLYISRNGQGNPFIDWPGPTPTPLADGKSPNGVDVLSPSCRFVETLAPPELGIPGNLDVALDGTLYVISRVPSPWGEPPEGPTPTPRPSLMGGRGNQGALQEPEEPDPIEGVAIFEPNHDYRTTVRFSSAEDIAVGPAGVFLSRGVELFRLGEAEPFFISPAGRMYSAYFDNILFNLDVPVGGGLVTGMEHCLFLGLVMFDDPSARPAKPRLVGSSDAPYLTGPPYPLRIAASDEVAVLQGRFTGNGDPPDWYVAATNYLMEPQTVQRWTRAGQVEASSPLRSQLGVCAGSGTYWTRDVAIDGSEVYTVDQNLVQMRPDDLLPAWSKWPGALGDVDEGSRLVAVSADAGRVAVLDEGAAKVYVLDRDGDVIRDWHIAIDDTNALPVDLALHGDRVYLADRGRGRIAVRSVDGADLGGWPVHDGPASVAVGPSGDVFMLGRGGWGFRYSPSGELVASWPMPRRDLDALDIAVDVDDRVYVSYIQRESLGRNPLGREIVTFGIPDAGIWIFEPAPAEPSPPPDTKACLASPDKWAQPRSIMLGETVSVGLSVNGRCPGAYDPVQVVVLLDNSRSMNFNDAIGRARDAMAQVLGALDPEAAEVGLVTFEDGASLVSPLSRDIASVAALAVSQEAWGDTRLAPGIELAHQELVSQRGDPEARKIILIVSDGVFKDQPLAAAEAAREDGIELYAIVLPTTEFNQLHLLQLEGILGDPSHVFMDPDPADLDGLVGGMTRYRPEPGLFESIAIEDVVPANMRYIEGSARPLAEWDPVQRTITWRFGAIDADQPIGLSYELEPLEVGTWPTNVEATARYRDALANDGRLVFPIPEVVVSSVDHLVYVPYGAARSCLRRLKPVDVVLVMDTSTSMNELSADGIAKLDAAKSAADTFLAQLQWTADRAALVAFDRSARRVSGLSSDQQAVTEALWSLGTSRGTHIDLGLEEALALLAEEGRADAKPVLILLTDGLNNDGPEPVRAVARELGTAGVLVYTIGLGTDVDADLLRDVATVPEAYYPSPGPEGLEEIYHQISERLACDVP